MENAKEIINNFMTHQGYRRKRDVAAFFGVSPQALSLWIAKGEIPPKHLLKLSQENIMINPSKISTTSSNPGPKSSDESKIVIDYLMRENVVLKQEVESLRAETVQLKTPSQKGDLLDRIVADSLLICGRVSDGIITEVDGKWPEILGYDQNELVGHRYDREEWIHPDELSRSRKVQEKLIKSESITESRYSTIQRWKNGKTGKYIMLSMVWDINVQEDTAIVVCKPIDGFFDAKGVYN
ncbi:MAG: PAS domain-containing protein [Candidatus Marinimicrobia bacterium]|jgi:PAS domain S-box-containing protein|nr:PAS domain-containing protein [Candidatus Neomarinimicrobiota bacterium]MBT3839573.1 PAS domain-containing protein [Candidatus Neomarinimicrobiota bacterium]MBT3999710.1 PAS domain-containing protein [Candidatus Neomarinimicrobiota bacterium]MBT4282099.1 PAS domain-containing protein [Candidatus Neomarinimicrobiota bacterium]MBT4578838.1 PAS domain-containing protein [Candidatus Neomarinimicrobiota bacterium]